MSEKAVLGKFYSKTRVQVSQSAKMKVARRGSRTPSLRITVPEDVVKVRRSDQLSYPGQVVHQVICETRVLNAYQIDGKS